MRRIILVFSLILICSIALIAQARSGIQSQQSAAIEGLADTSQYGLGSIMEGNGPDIEFFAPDAFDSSLENEIQQEGEIPVPADLEFAFDHYPDSASLVEIIESMEARYPDLVELYDLGPSTEGRPVMAIRVTAEKAPGKVEDRPAMYVDGQHHARELIGTQATLYNAWRLLDGYENELALETHLLRTRVFYFIPSVNVDGNQYVIVDDQTLRRTANPECCDDDRDGRFDEDSVQGYGYGTHRLRHYMFEQEWANMHPDDPFVDGWRLHLIGRPMELGLFTGALGGEMVALPQSDADEDGRVNEDPVGGTDANRNYDWFWEDGEDDSSSITFRGPAVWSEPEVRAVRDFTEGIPHLAAAVSYHSGVDLLLMPWGYSRTAELPDAELYELLGRKGSQLTEVHGFQGTVRTWTARGLYGAMGSTMDYLYGAKGFFSFSPEVYEGSSRTFVERVRATGTFTVGVSTGFSFNPRPEDIQYTVDRWNRWTQYLMAATPNIELNALELEASNLGPAGPGKILDIQMGSEGVMPVSLSARIERESGELLLDLPVEAELMYSELLHWRVDASLLTPEGGELSDAPYRLVADLQLEVGTVPHRVEHAEWLFSIDEAGELEILEGEIMPFTDLSQHFEDGWWAGDEWNEERYRCPRTGQPCPPQIFATPPAAPVAGPTPTTILNPQIDLPPTLYLPFLDRG